MSGPGGTTEAAVRDTRLVDPAHAAALLGCMWLATVVNDWLLNQVVPLIQLGLDDPIPFVVGRYAWPLALSGLLAATGWWYVRPGDLRPRVRWVATRVLGTAGWLLLGLSVTRTVSDIVSWGGIPPLTDGAQGTGHWPYLLPAAVAAVLIVVALALTPRRALPPDLAPASGRRRRLARGVELAGCAWVAVVAYQLLVLVALPAVRGATPAAADAAVQLAVQLGLAVALALVAGWLSVGAPGRGPRPRMATAEVLETTGWALVGLGVSTASFIVSTFGFDSLRPSSGFVGLGPETYLTAAGIGALLALLGGLLRRRAPAATLVG